MSDVDDALERINKQFAFEHAQQSKIVQDHIDATDRIIAGQAAQVVLAGAAKLLDPTQAVTP